jgi:dienelactone hydrolase
MKEQVMIEETVTYEADGLEMHGRLFVDPARAGVRPGVLVFPEIFGCGDHAKSRAARLAELGYAALACDLHGQGRVINDLQEVQALMAPVRESPALIRARAVPALAALRARAEIGASKVAAIGYCFGGLLALELARSGADIAGVVTFHGGLVTRDPKDAQNIRAKILVCTGADDPGIPAEQRSAFEQEMTDAGVDWQMHVYGGVVHSFTNPAAAAIGRPEFARYDAAADRRSWASMRDFFGEIFSET